MSTLRPFPQAILGKSVGFISVVRGRSLLPSSPTFHCLSSDLWLNFGSLLNEKGNLPMNSVSLKEVLSRAESWPVEDQNELIQAAAFIEQKHHADFQLDDADWKIIDARIKASKLNGLASDEDVAKVFGKYRAAWKSASIGQHCQILMKLQTISPLAILKRQQTYWANSTQPHNCCSNPLK